MSDLNDTQLPADGVEHPLPTVEPVEPVEGLGFDLEAHHATLTALCTLAKVPNLIVKVVRNSDGEMNVRFMEGTRVLEIAEDLEEPGMVTLGSLAHEVSHTVTGDFTERYSKLLTVRGLSITAGVLGIFAWPHLNILIGVAALAVWAVLGVIVEVISHRNEKQCDAMAVNLLDQAGVDGLKAVTAMLEHCQELTGPHPFEWIGAWTLKSRLKALKAFAEEGLAGESFTDPGYTMSTVQRVLNRRGRNA